MGQLFVSGLVYAVVAAASLVYARDADIDRRQSTPGQAALSYVDPLIGTNNGGHVFAGATLPFGMAKSVADVNGEDQGGFATDGSMVTGFSHMHDSGTGGGASLGNFPLFPFTSCPNGQTTSQCTADFSKDSRAENYIMSSVKATPGYFGLTLQQSQIQAEMTVTNRSALYKFTFPAPGTKTTVSNGTYSPLIIAEVADLTDSQTNGEISVDPKTGRITGRSTFNPSFGQGTYNLSFCADFQGAAIRSTSTNLAGIQGAYVQFAPPTTNNTIYARVGVSFISNEQACANAEKEMPDYDFEKYYSAAISAWEQKLGVITLDDSGVDDNLKKTFWSGVYRGMISPQDYTGENYLWQSDEPYYDSYYCIWDSFRSIHQLITLLDPLSQTLMVRSLIDIYRHEGWLPDCRMSLCKGLTQGGSNADIVLADSYLKGINQGVDWNTGYAAVVQDAENEPPNWDIEGRGNLAEYHTLGYVPINGDDYNGTMTRSISRTVEYAYDDFCIAEIAQGLGKSSDASKYYTRSSNWKNLFKPNQTSDFPSGANTGFTGYLQPKNPNGSWGYQDPLLCSPLNDFTGCYLNPTGHETYEGSCWLYTFFAPGDIAALIKILGGADSFVKRLDYMHDQNIVYIGDEQGFLTVFQYHFAGRPGLSSHRAHFYIPSQFNDTDSGLAGNDDSGAMGSFITLTMMGIFPNPGQNVYFITPPFFKEVSIKSGVTGKTATIRNINFDAPAYKNIYVQNATLNGQAYTKNWLDHSFFLDGGVLELTLGPQESEWGTQETDLPPSLSTTGPHPGVGQ